MPFRQQWTLRGLGAKYQVVRPHQLPTGKAGRHANAVVLVQALRSLRADDPFDRELMRGLFSAAHGASGPFGLPISWDEMSKAVQRSFEAGRLVALERMPLAFAVKLPSVPSVISRPEPASEQEKNTVSISLEANHFAPEVETVDVRYQISGPLDQVTSLVLTVERLAAPGKVIFQQKLPTDQAGGKFTWKGNVPGFAGGFLTVRGSPYELKLSMDTRLGKVESNKAKLSVAVLELKVQVDDGPAAKVAPAHQDAIAQLKKDVNAGKTGQLFLKSSIFKTKSAEMNDGSSFRQYKKAWNRGIPVSLLACVTLRGKSGTGKSSLKALHGAKLLWDVSLGDDAAYTAELDNRGVHSKAKEFINKVSAYQKEDSEPVGRACHQHFGGERAKTADKGSDKYWEVLQGTWELTEGAKRKWAASSALGVVGETSSDSGIKFWGGRMAGDTFSIRAYLDVDGTLDEAGDIKLDALPETKKSKIITWTNWRLVEVAKMYKIGEATPEISLPQLNGAYMEAAVKISAKPGLKTEQIQDAWKKEYQTVLASMASDDTFLQNAALADPGLHPVAFRDFADYVKQTENSGGLLSQLNTRVNHLFNEPDEDAYREKCSTRAYLIYMKIVQRFDVGADGLTLYNFGGYGEHNQPQKSGVTVGIAPDVDGKSGRNAAVFLLFAQGQSGNTLIHEIGHHLFLAHGPGHFNEGMQPPGYQPKAHDPSEFCAMSYHSSEPTIFCGLCQLKLRGWDYTKVGNDGSIH